MVMYPWVWQAILRETAPRDFTIRSGVNGYEIGIFFRGQYVGYMERDWMSEKDHKETDPWLKEMAIDEHGDRVPLRSWTRASWRTCLFKIALKLPPDTCRKLKAVARAKGFAFVEGV